MGRHAHRCVLERAERRQVGVQFLRPGMDDRQFQMAVDQRAAMAGHMLDDAHHIAVGQPLDHGATKRRDAHRFGAQRPVAHDVACARLPHVQQRQRIDRDANLRQHQRQSPRIGPRRRDRAGRRNVIEMIEHRAGGKAGPDRRLHPRDPAALLIDHDQQVVAPVQRAQFVGQRPHLRAIGDVALEQDIAGRLRLGKEGALVGGQGFAG